MNNSLRTYQSDLYLAARRALTSNRSVCIQLATGAGKTPVMAAMCDSVNDKDKLAWIIVNRKELITQTSAHLSKWNVPHNTINPRSNESKSFNIHVVSSDTLIRRFNKIKRWPHLLLIDECHLMIDRQIEIAKHLPETSKIIGMTATPERGDGRGLWSGASDVYKIINGRVSNERMEGRGFWSSAGGIYDELIEGPSIPWLTEHDFLAPLRYFSPPLEGLSDLHIRKGEYDEEELDALLKRKKIYGELVGHYSNHGKGKPALIFCRSIKAADQTAERFRDKGFKFFNIDSTMTDARRRELIAALTNGKIDGLCGVDIFSYGIDIPRVEYGATIRPTFSRAVYMQGVGRILRPWSDPVTGYKKEEALFFDHVNNLLEHQDAAYPGIPLHYAPHITWNFNGTEKRKRAKNNNVVLCPHLDFLYCPRPHCATCEHNPDKTVKDVRKPMVVIPAELIEAPHPIPLMDRPPEERREIQDRIGEISREYKLGTVKNPEIVLPGPVGAMINIAYEIGISKRKVLFWVYHKLNNSNRLTINIPLLSEIIRQKEYKPGFIWIAAKQLRYEKNIKRRLGHDRI